MDRRHFLSISALSLLAGTELQAQTPIVALPFHLTKSDALRNKYLSTSKQIGFLNKRAKPVFYYYRLSELELAMHAFSLGMINEVWTTPALLTHYREKFIFTAAMGVHELHLEKLSAGLRSALSPQLSLGYFSLPETKYYFAETSPLPPEFVRTFHPFRQRLFGPIGDSELTIQDSLPITLIRKDPVLRQAKLHLDTFSHPVHLGLIIKRDHRQLDITEPVNPFKYEPKVPTLLNAVFEKFQSNAEKIVQNYWEKEHTASRVLLG